MKKYELTNETKIVNGHTLHRIKALRSFGNVIEGELGGYIESEDNLSQEGDCWISDEACVYENAKVSGNAWIADEACVYDYANVSGDAWIAGGARIFEYAAVSGHAVITDTAWISGHATVSENAEILGDTWVYENAQISGHARIVEHASVYGDAVVSGCSIACGYAKIEGSEAVEDLLVTQTTEVALAAENKERTSDKATLLPNIQVLEQYTDENRKGDALILRLGRNGRPLSVEPYVYAYGFRAEDGSWSAGKYFQTLEEAVLFSMQKTLSSEARHLLTLATDRRNPPFAGKVWTASDIADRLSIPLEDVASGIEAMHDLDDISVLNDCTDEEWEAVKKGAASVYGEIIEENKTEEAEIEMD